MILLRHIKIQTNESLDILIAAAYEFWKSLSPLFAINNDNDSDVDKQLKVDEYNEVKKIVKEAYTTLLGGPLRNKVHAYEYCKLSHIYIAEGSLLGALQITQLASARGYLENTLIIMQSWSILTRVRTNQQEAFSAMLYLSSSIALDERPLPDSNGNTWVSGSDLNLA
jgi:hypothetical protein